MNHDFPSPLDRSSGAAPFVNPSLGIAPKASATTERRARHGAVPSMSRLTGTLLTLLLAVVGGVAARAQSSGALGAFTGETDVGSPARAGSAKFDATTGIYRVTGGGDNMWFTNDSFHFVWKLVTNDFTLAADLAFTAAGGNAHRKACLIVRQSLDRDAAYVDVAVHGEGLTSLQYRDGAGARTSEIQANVSGPKRVRLEKRGDHFSMSVAREGEPLHPAAGWLPVKFVGPFYVGLAVCAHDNTRSEEAAFSNLEWTEGAPATPPRNLVSTLESITISSKDRRVVYWTTNRIEAPNWLRDGTNLLFNSKGHLYRLPVAGGEPELIDTGFANRCNNDHGQSPDGSMIALSDSSQSRTSLVYVVSLAGGAPRRLTPVGPSYWHGWSPDGKTLAYCADRGGEFDIYTMPVEGGEETRLTTAKGLDDGPEYSPDGQFIYFNSERTGSTQIWRMKPDGSQQEPVTADEYNNWFPHLSPDGRWIVFVSYFADVKGHPENKDVLLRIMPAKGGKIDVLAKLFGGQGTMNVPSWSPDSRRLAFVSYQMVP